MVNVILFILILINLFDKERIINTWLLGDIEFLFEWTTRYLTGESSETNFIQVSKRDRVTFHSSYMALNRASDVSAADWRSQTHGKNQMKIWSSNLLDNLSNCLMNLKNFSGSWDNCLNCPASARIISSFDFKHRTSYNISFTREKVL